MTTSNAPLRGNRARLRFPDRDSPTTFAERRGWPYLVREPPRRRLRPKSYADNFRYDIAGAVARASREWDGALSLSDRRKQERDTSTADPAAILPHLDAPARSAEVANRV
jgi:ETC complex I subunit conserved region